MQLVRRTISLDQSDVLPRRRLFSPETFVASSTDVRRPQTNLSAVPAMVLGDAVILLTGVPSSCSGAASVIANGVKPSLPPRTHQLALTTGLLPSPRRIAGSVEVERAQKVLSRLFAGLNYEGGGARRELRSMRCRILSNNHLSTSRENCEHCPDREEHTERKM
jgi:hypothetical protein